MTAPLTHPVPGTTHIGRNFVIAVVAAVAAVVAGFAAVSTISDSASTTSQSPIVGHTFTEPRLLDVAQAGAATAALSTTDATRSYELVQASITEALAVQQPQSAVLPPVVAQANAVPQTAQPQASSFALVQESIDEALAVVRSQGQGHRLGLPSIVAQANAVPQTAQPQASSFALVQGSIDEALAAVQGKGQGHPLGSTTAAAASTAAPVIYCSPSYCGNSPALQASSQDPVPANVR